MKALGIRERLDDALNPIVVKELRQAVQSKFVVAVLLLFLLVQLVIIGIFLVITGLSGQLQSLNAEIGRSVFWILQIILLITCLLFLPAYTGLRLAAERSDTNVDLLFVTTLRPRAIIWGKFVAAVVIGVLIFSACTPFMVFTYLLRGIEAPSILLVVGIDFLVVLALVQLAIFFAVIPANWVLKALIGLIALGTLVFTIGMTLSGTWALIYFGSGNILETRQGWVPLMCMVGMGLAGMALFYSWSVALINPASSNRGIGMRLTMLGAWLATGVLFGVAQVLLPDLQIPLNIWVGFMGGLSCLAIVIAINERESWTPRVARTIPRRWGLRLPAFLLYSGAAGGVLFALALFGLTCLAIQGWQMFYLDQGLGDPREGRRVWEGPVFRTFAAFVLYTYGYAMAAVFLRRVVLRTRAIFTWIVMVLLVGLGGAVPFLVAFLFLYRDWRFEEHYYYLLSNPFTAAYAIGERRFYHSADFFLFAAILAAVGTLLNLFWYVRQMARFRPYRRAAAALEPPVLAVSAAQMDETKTAG
jgi:hypothetical protein